MDSLTIYTIGYTGFTREELVKQLAMRNINVLVDVRSSPMSERYPDFNRPELSEYLLANGIIYRNYAEEFGARQDDSRFYTDDGYLDFKKFAQSERFLGGIEKILRSAGKKYRFVLMCAEKDPINCHRAILVARAFYERGCKIIHILPQNREITQADIERELLDKYFPRRAQISFDDMDGAITEEELIDRAYNEQAKKIAYRPEEE